MAGEEIGLSRYENPDLEDDRRYPWERLPEETPHSYAGWRSYMDCPKPRTLRRAAALHYHGDPEEMPTDGQHRLFKKWSAAYNWMPRIEEYEEWLDYRKRLAEGAEAEKMGRRHAQQALLAIEELMLPFRMLAKKIGNAPLEETNLYDLPEADLLKLGIVAARVVPRMQVAERLARGEPTEIVEGHTDHDHRHIHLALQSEQGKEALRSVRDALFVNDGDSQDLPGDAGPLSHGGELPPG